MILHQISNEIGLIPINSTLTGSIGAVPDNALTTILTLTAGTVHKVTRISCSGSDYAKFQIFINSSLIETRRSSPERTIDFLFLSPLKLEIGQILDVKVTHYYTGDLGQFESTIYSIT